jgi:MoaD family protein
MKLLIKLLRPFSDVIGKKELEIEFNGLNIYNLLELLVNKYPKLENEFFSEKGKVTDYICIFINDKPLAALNGLKTKLKNDDEILFFVPISGG